MPDWVEITHPGMLHQHTSEINIFNNGSAPLCVRKAPTGSHHTQYRETWQELNEWNVAMLNSTVKFQYNIAE